MDRSDRLLPIIRLLESRELDAARQVGACRDNLARQRQTLAELKTFQNEYTSRFNDVVKGGVGAGIIHDYHRFLTRLNQTIRQQQKLVETANSQHESSKQQWWEQRCQTKAMDKVAEQYRSQECIEREQREQRESDERAQFSRGVDFE
jgi:flagellar export protein FliJ